MLRLGAGTRGLRQGALPRGAAEAENSFGDRGWGGPCPPEDDPPHRYVFALYALARPLDAGPDASPDELRKAIGREAIARGTLTVPYGR